jgi:hypothetical protein
MIDPSRSTSHTVKATPFAPSASAEQPAHASPAPEQARMESEGGRATATATATAPTPAHAKQCTTSQMCVDPAVEAEYWRGAHASRPYASDRQPFDQYEPAYRLGWESQAQNPGETRFEAVEASLSRRWDNAKGTSKLAWEHAKVATREAWERASKAFKSNGASGAHSEHVGTASKAAASVSAAASDKKGCA